MAYQLVGYLIQPIASADKSVQNFSEGHWSESECNNVTGVWTLTIMSQSRTLTITPWELPHFLFVYK